MNRAMSPAEILKELVAISTPSSDSNLPLLYWVTNYLEPFGWNIQYFPYRDERDVAKANLIARQASAAGDSKIELAFICHTDTVPLAANWPDALHVKEREGNLHGCGACDVKGALACFLAAVAQMSLNQVKSDVALILTADEETGCKGMERLLAATQLKIGSAIISEPTSLRAGVAGKGYGLARVTVRGREAHSAFPQQGVSAISIAARLITRLEDNFVGESITAATNSLFDPPRTTLNIGTIEGGSAKNIIAGDCTFLLEWRPVPNEDPGWVAKLIQSTVDEFSSRYPLAGFLVEVLRNESGFSPKAGGKLENRLVEQLQLQRSGISFGSEASRVARVADEVIVIGPGDMRTAHSDRERVPISELEAWTGILSSLFVVD